MSAKIQIPSTPDITVYVNVHNDAGLIWSTISSTFVTSVDADWGNYDIALTEEGTSSGYYIGDFPSDVPDAGIYSITAYQQIGGSPAVGDILIGADEYYWNIPEGNTPPTAGNLTTKTYVKVQNGWTDSTYDLQIDQMLPVISQGINNFLGRVVPATNYTEIRNGQGTNYLRVWNPPINSITNVTFNFNGSVETVVDDADLVWDTDDNGGFIKTRVTSAQPSYFAPGFQNIKIVYNGGFATVPYSIQSAAALTIRKLIELSDDERLVVEKSEGSRKIKYDQKYAAAAQGNFSDPFYTECMALLLPYQVVRYT